MCHSHDSRIVERKDLRHRTGLFRDRAHAGKVLVEMLDEFRDTDAFVMAVPRGPLATAQARP